MSPPSWVLDTGALMAYSRGVEAVGRILVDAADAELTVAVPLVCLIEAYRQVDEAQHDLLRVMGANRTTRLAVPVADDCPIIGHMAGRAGRLGAGHAAYAGLVNAAGVVTSRPDQIRAVLGEQWPVVHV